jgi:hypothetical protein
MAVEAFIGTIGGTAIYHISLDHGLSTLLANPEAVEPLT